MRKTALFLSSLFVLSTSALATTNQKTFMPANDLDKQAAFQSGGLTEAQFNAVIDRVDAVYAPIIKQFGANLTWDRAWSDETVNASSDQPSPTEWAVHMYGGLARRAEVTEDGFTMVICHELGHHLSGYPYVSDWAANEGQADMHATGACAAKVFAANPALSAKAADDIPTNMKAKCDANHADAKERDVCYRSVVAAKSLADLLGALGNTPVSYDTTDTSTVTVTNDDHPAAQCRLDTYIASAMCGADKWDYKLIPGKTAASHNSLVAQTEAYAHSCETGDGARPRCWFAALTKDPTPGGDCPYGDASICQALCQFDPTQAWCKH